MATKKPTTKKAPVKKPSATRKSTTKKPAAKRSAASRVSLRNHIGLQPEQSEFMTFRITKQTLYWLVLGAVVILFTLWLTKLQTDIQDLYDQVDASTIEVSNP